jgi:hypothetical protein
VCTVCGGTTWRNPLPVAVAILPVVTPTGVGVVVQRRDIEPARGLLALPGGFIEHGEDWRAAGAESGRPVCGDADSVQLCDRGVRRTPARS